MYLFLDTETGGLDPDQHSLLTAAFEVTEDDFTHKDLFYTSLPHAVYKIDADALSINGIDLVVHHKEASKLTGASERFEQWLNSWYIYNDGKLLTAVGWNIPFDLGFIYAQLLHRKTFQRYVSYHVIDAMVLAECFVRVGKLPRDVTRLTKAAQHFSINIDGAHNALVDAQLTKEVFKKLLEML